MVRSRIRPLRTKSATFVPSSARVRKVALQQISRDKRARNRYHQPLPRLPAPGIQLQCDLLGNQNERSDDNTDKSAYDQRNEKEEFGLMLARPRSPTVAIRYVHSPSVAYRAISVY